MTRERSPSLRASPASPTRRSKSEEQQAIAVKAEASITVSEVLSDRREETFAFVICVSTHTRSVSRAEARTFEWGKIDHRETSGERRLLCGLGA